ncbi:MAG: DUF2065 domain-containing protein [Coxiellaceae bacterium]|nr:MAG: DUF2065 domain-containing protein [Coxiellaceae bacterium]
MWGYFLTGLALVLVFEGILPFLSPVAWRVMMFRLIQRRNHTIRSIGLFSMLAGAILMCLIHSGIFIN